MTASKTRLIVKLESFDLICEVFKNTDVAITSEGRPHLWASDGSWQFITDYANEKVESLTASLLTLSKLGKFHLYVTYCAYIHGLTNKINGHIYSKQQIFLICNNL